MDYRLQEGVGKNTTRYFFSLLGPRFEAANELMADSLSRRFGYVYKPIYIFSSHPNKFFQKENYIVLNKRAYSVESQLRRNVIYLQEYEDLNEEFARSPLIKKIADQLLRTQEQIPVYSFTSSFLNLKSPRWMLLGPSASIANHYDNKINQYELFERLGLPRNKARIFKSKNDLLKGNHAFPGYITAAYASGGNESGFIYSKEMLSSFLSKLRNVNARGRFLVADIFEGIVSMPNVNAIVTGKGNTSILVISDQIMRGTRYLGNVYPSSISGKHAEEIKKITIRIGDHLSKKGYRGLFGCDFLINKKGKLVVVDLNPRRQGGYVCNMLALKAVGINLAEIELSCALGEIPEANLRYNKIQYPEAWAHSKIKPHDPGSSIGQEMKSGAMTDIFPRRKGEYYATFYKKDSIFIDGYIGYVAATGKSAAQVLKKVTDIEAQVLKQSFA